MNFLRHFYPDKNINPQSAAIIYNDDKISYKQLNDSVCKAAGHLKKIGIKRNDNVALAGDNSREFIITILGLWNLGAVPVILNLRLLPKEIKNLAEFAECKVILTDRNDLDGINSPSTKVESLKFEFDNREVPGEEYADHDLNRTAIIMFTSGSSGKPKGVVLTFGNLLNSAEAGNEYFNLTEDDSYLASLPFFHIGGFSVIVRTFCAGAALIIPDSLEINDIVTAVGKYNPSAVSFVTTQMKKLLDMEVKPNPKLRSVLLGGGFIDEKLVSDAISKGWPAAKSYGSTETASFVTVLTPEQFQSESRSAGKPKKKNEIIIVDDDHNPLPPLQTGEIAVKSKSNATCYLKDESESAKKFIDGIYYSGDFGYLDEEGFLFVSARRSDLIISGGENIIPVEIENALRQHPAIKDACVFGVKDPLWGEAVAAALITDDLEIITTDELKDFLKDKLPGFKHPRKLFFVEDFPRSELGKVFKEELKEMLGAG